MKSRTATLSLLAAYATIASFVLSYFAVRDITARLSTRLRYDESKSRSAMRSEIISPVNQTLFPIRKHMVTHGHPRTATTLLFNMVAVSYFLYLQQNEPDLASALNVKFRRRGEGGKFLRHVNSPHVVKTHSSLDEYMNCDATIFTTAMDTKEAARTRQILSREGHEIAFVQDMQTLKEIGIPGLVRTYVKGFGLSRNREREMIEYFSNWELLRQCCGKQMSSRWRNDLFPEHLKNKKMEPHPICRKYSIDDVE